MLMQARKCFLFFILLLLNLEKIFCNEEYYWPKIYQNIWPDFCLEHITNFPKECSEHDTDEDGIPYLTYAAYGCSSSYIEKDLIQRLSNAALIPSNNKICSFLYCANCHKPVISKCLVYYDLKKSNDTVGIFNKCDCLQHWYNKDIYEKDDDYYLGYRYNIEEEDNNDDDYVNYNIDTYTEPHDDGEVIDFIKKNWIQCSNKSFPHEYFDYLPKQFFPFLEQLLMYSQENPDCLCFWPYRTKLACEISDIVYEKMKRTISNSFINQLNKTGRFSNLKNISGYGVLLCLFTHTFFYTQYQKTLLSLIEAIESSNNDDPEISETINILYDVMDSIRPLFIELYTECLGKHPHQKIYYERGMAFLHSGKKSDALRDFEKSTDLSQNDNQDLRSLTKSIEKDLVNMP